MKLVHRVTQRDIDTQGHVGDLNSESRSLGLAVRRLLGRYEQGDKGRKVYRRSCGLLVLGGAHADAPR